MSPPVKNPAPPPARPRPGAAGGRGRGKLLGRPLRLTLLSLSLAEGILLGFLGHRWVIESPWFELRRVAVSGNSQLSEGEVVRLAGLRRENLFRVDLDGVRARLASHPWVREVRVSRLLPDALRVELTERVPSALLRVGGPTPGGALFLVDGGGVVLGPARERGGERGVLPEVALPGGGDLRPGRRVSRADFLWALRVARAFGGLSEGVRRGLRVEPEGEDVARAWARGGRWTIRLSEEDLEGQLARLGAVEADLLRRVGEARIEVDLTSPGRVVVRRSQEGGERG